MSGERDQARRAWIAACDDLPQAPVAFDAGWDAAMASRPAPAVGALVESAQRVVNEVASSPAGGWKSRVRMATAGLAAALAAHRSPQGE